MGEGCVEDMEVGVQVSPGSDFSKVVVMYHDQQKNPTFKTLFDACRAHMRWLKARAEKEERPFLSTPHLVMGIQQYGALALEHPGSRECELGDKKYQVVLATSY